MTSAIIVDDERLARRELASLLAAHPEVAIVGEAASVDEAAALLRTVEPDIVFLDIQMPRRSGFELLEAADVRGRVVFVTAHDIHAIRAFEVNALDYVLKPFPDERLLAALDRARSAIQERRNGELGRRLAAFVQDWQAGTLDRGRSITGPSSAPTPTGPGERLDAIDEDEQPVGEARSGPTSYIGRFAVRSDGRVRFVSATDVDWIEADGNYMVLHVGDAQHRLRASLAGLTSGLDPRRFVRIHRSVIVNVERIREVQPWFGGDYIAILHTGAKLRVSRLRAAQLLKPTA